MEFKQNLRQTLYKEWKTKKRKKHTSLYKIDSDAFKEGKEKHIDVIRKYGLFFELQAVYICTRSGCK